ARGFWGSFCTFLYIFVHFCIFISILTHIFPSAASPWPSPRGSPRWQAAVAPALVRNGVRLRGNRLVVPRDGLYFVYASAAFAGGRCGRGGAPRRPLRLAVSRLSREYPRDVPLLRAARSVCPAGALGGLWAETLYQGAVFQLRRGDRLAATASAGRFLDLHGAGQAYFGVLGVD
uniref:Lymphotoxin-alpha n=1 Tax=Geospiza parvula TaxID=87175 RepID=A0A8U8BYR0_GEOPR